MDIATELQYAFDKVKESVQDEELKKNIIEIRNKYRYVVLFGLGGLGRQIYKTLNDWGIEVDYICDNNISSETIQNRLINFICPNDELKQASIRAKFIAFEDLLNHKDHCIVFVTPSNTFGSVNNSINKQLT